MIKKAGMAALGQNQNIKLMEYVKSYVSIDINYILQINSAILLRRRPFEDEKKVYNDTLDFIENLPLKIDKDKISILIGHVPLALISKKQAVHLHKVSWLLISFTDSPVNIMVYPPRQPRYTAYYQKKVSVWCFEHPIASN